MNSKGGAASPVQGLALTAFLVVLVAVSAWMFLQRTIWLPDLASVHGADLDRMFFITLGITGVMFVILNLLLAFMTFRYGERNGERAEYWLRPSVEKKFALIAGLIVFLVDVTLFGLGESSFVKLFGAPPENALLVEVTGEQFMWQFRYPGPDGGFGRTDPKLITANNPLGLDPQDPSGRDDVVSTNQLHLPVDRMAMVRLKSKDVIHSFFLPNHRVKQDAVPGMAIDVPFQPTKVGNYEIACNQICGLGHYRMKAFLTVETEESFNKWLADFAAEQKGEAR